MELLALPLLSPCWGWSPGHSHTCSHSHTRLSGCGQKTCRVHNQPQPPRTGPAETPAPVSRAAPGSGLGAEGQAQMAPPHGTCQHSQLAPSAHLLLLGEACWPQGSSRQQEHVSRSDEPARAAEATAPSCRERQEGDCHGTAGPGRAPLPEPSVLRGLAPRTRISPPVLRSRTSHVSSNCRKPRQSPESSRRIQPLARGGKGTSDT